MVAKPLTEDAPGITLENPVAHHFESFIAWNATVAERVVEAGSATGQHIVICGAGPSLRDTIAEHAGTADQLWGCNSALPWLAERGYPVTHGFTIDQTTEMVNEWWSAPDVEYLVASTVHPHLRKYLMHHKRRLTFFHNYCGIAKPPVQMDGGMMSYEDWLYSGLFTGTVRVGSGLNSVPRAIDVALYMNAAKVTVLGADCALRFSVAPPVAEINSPEYRQWLETCTELHADGGHAMASRATPLTLFGEIDGRPWLTKVDMIVSAVFLEKMRRALNGRLVLVGDTLPVALRDKSDEYLATLPKLVGKDGKAVEVVYVAPEAGGT
jgi:hypothetical protein